MLRLVFALAVFAVAAALVAAVPLADPASEQKGKGKRQPGDGSPEDALARVEVPKGLKAEVWAAEPMLANPVAFCFDEAGRVFVAETTRFKNGVPDTRDHMYWLDDDIACRTVADRVAMYQREYPPTRPGGKAPQPYAGFEKYDDQVRLLWDSTGAGKADKSSVFANGFNRPDDGLAAGVLARKGNLYFTCIPDLYLLKDTKGENKADVKQSLSTGYGLRVQFLGHDLHGLRIGPDGKLYFSIGDRGLNVTTKEGRKLFYPDTGCVLRCDLDGANLEVVHIGLRNPQKLAFDDHGNLFTFDNNSDSGDRARWVQIVEGGDSGWRCGYQYGTDFHTPEVKQGNRGPWNTEKIWYVPGAGGTPPAYVVPPLLHFGNGPSGITHYPGTGLAERYKDHFFCCDFTSDPTSSKIWSLAVKPKGASFEVTDLHEFVKGMVPTDCEFGPDGAFYWSDWTGGWNPPNKGRIFKVTDPEAMKNPAVAEAKKLIAEGFAKKTADELVALLGHPHQQVRQEAQFELAARESSIRLAKVARDAKNPLARLHAVWGLGMIANTHVEVMPSLAELAESSDSEVRAQVFKTLAGRIVGARGPDSELGPGPKSIWTIYLKGMADPEPRVRYYATIGYGQLGAPTDTAIRPVQVQTYFEPLFSALKTNNDTDAYLRHAAVVGLASSVRNPVDLWNAWTQLRDKYDTTAVRLGVLLALRRLNSSKVAEFLKDTEPRLVAEAARAIYDERIEGGMNALADLAEKPGQPDAVSFRALATCYKIGTPEAAAKLARFAARASEPDYTRVFALKLLGQWEASPRRDHITGLTMSPAKGQASVAADALKPVVAGVFTGSDKVRTEASQVSAKLGLKEVGPLMLALLKDAKAPVSSRVEALFALAAIKDAGIADAATFASSSPEPKLRAAGLTVKAQANPDAMLKELPALLTDEKVSIAEKQAALAVLGGFKESEAVDKLLDEWFTRMRGGKVPGELMLDVFEAAEKRAALKAKVEDYRKAVDTAEPPIKRWAGTETGGDAEKGRDIFLNNAAVYCQRCHKLDGQGGEVGPVLNGLAADAKKDRQYLLEAIVLPNAQIAKGYETVILVLADGRSVSGIVKSDDKKQIRLVTPENKELVIAADDVESRRTGPSAMPDDLHKKLTKRELRDLVEFLASLKEPEKK